MVYYICKPVVTVSKEGVMNIMKNLRLLKTMIKKRGLKQKWIAEKMGLSYPNFNNRLRGTVALSVDELIQLCEILQLTDAEKLRLLS